MTITRLRELPTLEEMLKLYQKPHDHRLYGHGHHLRVEQSIIFARWVWDWKNLTSVADLSCGNGAIAMSLNANSENLHLGDYADGYNYSGPIEETIDQIPSVDLYICSETIEHLDRPKDVLSKIREHSKWLFLSTPVDNWEDTNDEHLWAWSRSDVESLLSEASFTPRIFGMLDSTVIGEAYNYGMWVCS